VDRTWKPDWIQQADLQVATWTQLDALIFLTSKVQPFTNLRHTTTATRAPRLQEPGLRANPSGTRHVRSCRIAGPPAKVGPARLGRG